MKLNPTAARALRALLNTADQLHPAALLVLVLGLVGLTYAAAPVVVALLTALVTVGKSAALLAGAGILARLAIQAAASVTAASRTAVTA